MSEPLYRLLGVTKAYDGRVVLQVEHLEIMAGEMFALVGPSGAGKSTLLRLLNFLEPLSGGRLEFQGRDVSRPPVPLAVRRRVTTVFQRPLLLNRSVRDNVRFGLALRGVQDWRARTEAALEQVGLRHMAEAHASSLSGGEAQRVALARALVIQPQVLLLDEPTANLDPYNVALIEEIIQNLNHEQGITVVLVTHNVFQARRLASQAGLLLDGRLIEVAAAAEFFQAPADPRTAAFVRGEMVY